VHSESLNTNRNGAAVAARTEQADMWRLKFGSYLVLIICLAAGTLALPWGVQVAILPAAVVFGWSQSGGL